MGKDSRRERTNRKLVSAVSMKGGDLFICINIELTALTLISSSNLSNASPMDKSGCFLFLLVVCVILKRFKFVNKCLLRRLRMELCGKGRENFCIIHFLSFLHSVKPFEKWNSYSFSNNLFEINTTGIDSVPACGIPWNNPSFIWLTAESISYEWSMSIRIHSFSHMVFWKSILWKQLWIIHFQFRSRV